MTPTATLSRPLALLGLVAGLALVLWLACGRMGAGESSAAPAAGARHLVTAAAPLDVPVALPTEVLREVEKSGKSAGRVGAVISAKPLGSGEGYSTSVYVVGPAANGGEPRSLGNLSFFPADPAHYAAHGAAKFEFDLSGAFADEGLRAALRLRKPLVFRFVLVPYRIGELASDVRVEISDVSLQLTR